MVTAKPTAMSWKHIFRHFRYSVSSFLFPVSFAEFTCECLGTKFKATTCCILYDGRNSGQVSSFQFSRSVVSDSLWPHELQHTRPPCPSPTPRVHSDSRASSQWCHPAIVLGRPLLLLPPIPPSIRVFSNESTLRMRWPKYWSFTYTKINLN